MLLRPTPFFTRQACSVNRATCRLVRYSSSASSLIEQRDIPAPHCGSIRILSLNNPKSRNAISRALLTELAQHADNIHSEGPRGQTRALILASNVDSSFCAGADLKERANFTLDETRQFLSQLRNTCTSISALPIPSITAISSLALGGGLELALTTHLRIFASTATVALPESRLAIIPGAGGTYRLPALIGRNRALDMMLTGRPVAAAEAYFLGICDRLVHVEPEEDGAHGIMTAAKEREARLLDRARKSVLEGAVVLAREICEGGPIAIRQLIKVAAGSTMLEEMRYGEIRENEAYDDVIQTRDRNEALRSFREKRKPIFRGE